MAPDSRTTGRYIVLLAAGKSRIGARRLADLTGVRVLHAGRRTRRPPAPGERCAIVFDHIGVALLYCSADDGQSIAQVAAEGDHSILAIEPERRVFAAATGVSWGIAAVGADRSMYTGKGMRIAILDTGLDLQHPDFQNRAITARSFIEGEEPQDRNGHGTHCAGIAAGPVLPGAVPRYGVAGEAGLFIGKVLSDEGGGSDGSVLQGIDWAAENHCEIISMSLGSPALPGEPHSTVFETVARRALEAGTLIVAAAGNESRRPEYIAPVGHPANCPSILAVGAVDRDMQVAPFSCGGLSGGGGEVDLAAPGVDIPSAWPMPQGHNTISGTSMATPFVAGVAALHGQADPGLRGAALAARLVESAWSPGLPQRDVGAGIVQAPEIGEARPVRALRPANRES